MLRYSHIHMREKSMQDETCNMEAVNKLIGDGCGKQLAVEYTMFLDNLKDLDDWCKEHDKSGFFAYFQDASISAFYRYADAKAKTWSDEDDKTIIKWMNYASYASPFLMPVGTVVLSMLENHVDVIASNKVYLFAACAIGTVILSLLSAGRIMLCKRKEEDAKRNYYETWVRHSLCNSRLQLALSEFLVSKRTDADYEKFVDSTFAVLNQNLDQFAVNMCPRGAAPRPGKAHDKKR